MYTWVEVSLLETLNNINILPVALRQPTGLTINQ